jgi:threonine dehydrogenase-like Zn-dependent dehydrogenase
MQGLWLEDRVLRLRDDIPTPQPGPDEALVRVLCAGICNTDLELLRGYYPYAGVPGHEFIGRVDAAPTRADLVGERVVGEINAACGSCPTCMAGRERHCPQRTVLGIVGRNGALAEYLTLPTKNLQRVPGRVDDEAATFVEPLAAALEIEEQITLSDTDRVVVLGDGKLGQLVARTLARRIRALTVVGHHERKLGLLRDAGIASIADCAGLDRSADVVVECTGHAEGFALARRLVRPRGTIVIKSTYAGALTADFSSLVVDEITLVGSRCGPFAPAIELLARGTVDPRPLIEAVYPLSDALAAFEHAQRPGALKVLVKSLNDR